MNEILNQRLEYLHMNQVKAGFMYKYIDWINRSARNSAELPGKLNLELID